MTLTRTDLWNETADRLAAAYHTREAIAPISEDASLSIDDAYQIQLAQVKRWREEGDAVVGYKVGLTSRAMQRQLGVNQPDFGHLMTRHMLADHELVNIDGFLQPKVEPEIAFVLGADLAGPGLTVVETLRAVDYVVPALEIIDSRIRDWKIGIVDTVADNASCGAIVVGTVPTKPGALDLARLGCVLEVGGDIVDTGAGGAVLGSPVHALVWLANTLGRQGVAFRAGDVVLSGSVTAAHPVVSGSVVSARFAELGSVTATFRSSTADN